MLWDDERASRNQCDLSLEFVEQWEFEMLEMHDFELELPVAIQHQAPDKVIDYHKTKSYPSIV